MTEPGDEVVYEAAELSKAVFSSGEEVFRENYDGDAGNYMLVQDLRNRIEIATMDSGEMVYPEELESFEEFEADSEEAVRFFYGVGEDYDLDQDLAEVFEGSGLVESSGGDFFYGENAFPYLLLVDEAERIVEGPVEDDYEDPVEEDLEEDFSDENLGEDVLDEDPGEPVEDSGDGEEQVEEESEDQFERFQGIMEDAADSDDDLVFDESG
jgi:hypothetical protein